MHNKITNSVLHIEHIYTGHKYTLPNTSKLNFQRQTKYIKLGNHDKDFQYKFIHKFH